MTPAFCNCENKFFIDVVTPRKRTYFLLCEKNESHVQDGTIYNLKDSVLDLLHNFIYKKTGEY